MPNSVAFENRAPAYRNRSSRASTADPHLSLRSCPHHGETPSPLPIEILPSAICLAVWLYSTVKSVNDTAVLKFEGVP